MLADRTADIGINRDLDIRDIDTYLSNIQLP